MMKRQTKGILMKILMEIKKYRAILMSLAMAIVLGVFSCLVFSIWKEYKDAIIDNQKKQMLLTTQSMGDNLKAFIEGYQADINSLCAMEEENYKKTGEKTWNVLEEYVNYHTRYVYDAILEDKNGTLLKSLHGFAVKETYSVTGIDDNMSFRQCKLENGEMYLVVKKNLDDGNSVSIVINTKSYNDTLVSNIRLGTNGYVLLKDSKGTILVHPQRSQWGINVITGRQIMFPNVDLTSLEQMIERQNRGETGVAEYYSYWWEDPGVPEVKKISAFCPVFIGDGFLVMSAVIDYNDIYVPVAAGFFKLGLVSVGIVAVVLGMVFYIGALWLQKRKDREEIDYLIELNNILEEMHQSEETIAHQQRLQIMGTMTGGIAHEFNNLLTPIMGYAELLMLELEDASDSYDNAMEIYDASAKAKEIIQQISSLSRKNMETAYKSVNAGKVLHRAAKMVTSVCPSNVKVEEEIYLEEECFLGNETQMNQVILNICVNAIHAIGHKEGKIVIKACRVMPYELEQYKQSSVSGEWDSYIRIDVSDNGEGMSEEVLKQIFDPFFTTKKNGSGTGLGLSLVEQIIHSHKGHIFAESRMEIGSVFHIFLPVNEHKAQETSQSMEAERDGALKLLIIDDNPKVLKLLEKSFSKLKVTVFSCMNFEEARKTLKEQEVDAVISEQYVAGKSGANFCMSLKGTYPRLIRIIDKPVSDSAILKAVKNCIEKI
jgi:signal transduction histidine kinase